MTTSKGILAEEIDSWKLYGDSLCKENRDLFFKMLSEVAKYQEAAKTKGERFSFESLCMALLFEQQKMITRLFQKLTELNQA